jgi:serine/threonine protein kinase
LQPDEWVEHFQIIRCLGRGGMGEVYLARDSKLGRKVAIKVIRRKVFRNPEAWQRFFNEAKVTARFSHPHIVTLYSVGEHRGLPYVVLEYLPGPTLRGLMERGAVGGSRAIELMIAVAEALEEAHRHQILHRDLKPENLIIPQDGRVRVLDFGLAKVVTDDDMSLAATMCAEKAAGDQSPLPSEVETQAGTIRGTPFYMAPEQWQGQPCSGATDVWALGVLLYELLAGHRPFEGPTVYMMAGKVISAAPAPPLPPLEDEELEPIHGPLAELLARCLNKEAAQRPSAKEVATTLRRLGKVKAPPVRRRRRPLAAALSAALLLLLVAGGHWLWSRRPPSAPRETAVAAGWLPRMTSSKKLVRVGTDQLNELRGSEFAPAMFWGLLHDEPDGRVTPVLVDQQPSLDNGGARPNPQGGLDVTWKLRPGLRWSDGHPLHAEDLLLALEVFPNPHLLSFKAPDRRTLILRWDEVLAAAVDSIRPLPRHRLAKLFTQGGAKAVLDVLQSQPTPVIGPYRVTDFAAGKRLVLEANPHFVGPAPAIERVEVLCREPAELVRLYEANQLDVILPEALSLEQALDMRRGHAREVHLRPSNTLLFLQPDVSHGVLRHQEVRQALLQAIDRAELVTSLFGSWGRVAHAPLTGPLPAGIVRHPFARRKSANLLRRVAGQAREIPLFHGSDPTLQQAAQQLELNLEKGGLEIAPRGVSDREARELFRSTRHGGLLLQARRISLEHSALPLLNLRREPGGYNLSQRHSGFDEQMAALVAQEARALHRGRRWETREALWMAFSERLPLLPLAFSAERLVVRETLRGWDNRPGDRFGRGLENWYFQRPTAADQSASRLTGTDDLDE